MSFSSTQSAPAQRVPAWKRLGLKLKSPSSSAESGSSPSLGAKPNRDQVLENNATKRKRPDFPAPSSSSPFKKARHVEQKSTPLLKRQKSVTFTNDTKQPAIVAKPKQSKAPKKISETPGKVSNQSNQPIADIKPALEYLRRWRTSRETWKFNKNFQTLLMKRVFEADSIPSDDIDAFYEYIRDLKGHVRKRLRIMALEITKEDAESGSAGFPEGTKDADAKQSEYEKVLLGLMKLGSPGTKRKHFDEVQFVSQSSDTFITQRVIKRMRAEVIADELSDSEESDATTTTTTSTTASSQNTARDNDSEKRVKLNDGSGKKAPRRRSLRTNMDDDSDDESTSDSSDESDGSDTSSSSDEESEDEGLADGSAFPDNAVYDVDTSSSSESSSDGESTSDEEDNEVEDNPNRG